MSAPGDGDGDPISIAATQVDGQIAPTVQVPRTAPDSPTHRELAPTMAPDVSEPPTQRETPVRTTIRPPQARSSKDTRYVLGEEIARGGMGRVVAASDTLLGRTVAIKEVLVSDEDLRLRFLRETKITARLEHPSIVPLYDAGTLPDGSPYYVMRRVTGKPLADLVDAATTLPQRLALLPNLFAAANAIAHAHARGIVHRDIKPSNILVGELGETVVIDWGLAKLVGEPDDPAASSARFDGPDGVHTQIGSVVGTPGFMAPEQLRGEHVDARSDVYALGASLYYLLSRRSPHAARTGEEMMVAALEGPPTPLRDLVSGVPAELATIVDKALAYTHSVRYADAGGLAADLDRFLRGQLVASHRYSTRERIRRFWQRHRISISIALTALVAITIGAWLSVSRIITARRRADAALAESITRNESLQLAHARVLLRTNPRQALELIRPLASRYWREAGAIALAARAAGIARELPASITTSSLELSTDGIHALSVGDDDGVVRVYDVAAGTSRVVTTLPERPLWPDQMRAIFADGDRAIVVWGGGHTAVVDAATGVRRELSIPMPVRIAADGTQLWWLDQKGSAWTRGLAEGQAPRALAVADNLRAIAVQNGVVALGGKSGLWVVRNEVATSIRSGDVASVAWLTSDRLAAVIDKRVVVVDLVTNEMETFDVQDAHEVDAAPNGAIVVHRGSDRYEVLDRWSRFELPPSAKIPFMVASTAGPYLLGAADAALLVWDLREVWPGHTKLPGQADWTYGHDDQLVIQHLDQTVSWFDGRTGEMTSIPMPVLMSWPGTDSDGRRLAICDREGHGRIYTRAQPAGEELRAPCSMALWYGDTLVLGSNDGEVSSYDIRTQATKLLFKGTSRVWALVAPPSQEEWVGAVFDDNLAWRGNLRTGASGVVPPVPGRLLELRNSGEGIVRDSPSLRFWNVDGSLTPVTDIPAPYGNLLRVDDDHVVVIGRSASGYLLDLATRKATKVYPPGTNMNSLVYVERLGTYISADDSVGLTTPMTGDAWVIGRPSKYPLRGALVLRDQSTVYAVAGDTLLRWSLPAIETQQQTLALLDALLGK